MDDFHQAFLLLGSNIHPETHLRRGIELLQGNGKVAAVSRAWESRAVGGEGPNFLNACVLCLTQLAPEDVNERIIRPAELALGRRRTADRYAPRPMDIDLLLYDEQPLRLEYWDQAFAVVPLAELVPHLRHPATGEPLSRSAARLRADVWIVPRPGVLAGLQSVPAGSDP
jgi:2-amino-4-hydroxy-6-hydroxymethyldihydropteridine diphosphokinase